MSQGAIPEGQRVSSRVAVWPRVNGPGSGREVELVERLAVLAGEGRRVLVVGRRDEAIVQGLRGLGLQVAQAEPTDSVDPIGTDATDVPLHLQDTADGGARAGYDVVLATDILGRVSDPRAMLRGLQGRIRPGGTLVATLTDVETLGDELALGAREATPDGPLGRGSRLIFRLDGLLDLFEESGFAIGQLDQSGPDLPTEGPGGEAVDLLIVAHPLPAPGYDVLRRRLRDQAEARRAADREAVELRRCLEAADRRLDVLTRHQEEASARVKDLRSKLLDAHRQLLHRDDEIRATFGGALHERAALLGERDALIAQRDGLIAERDRLAGLAAERDAVAAHRDHLAAERAALADHRDALAGRVEILRAELENARELGRLRIERLELQLGGCMAERDALASRLDRFRRSVPGRAYLAARRLIAPFGARTGAIAQRTGGTNPG